MLKKSVHRIRHHHKRLKKKYPRVMNHRFLFQGLLFLISLTLAYWFFKSEYIHHFLDVLIPIKYLAEIIAGIFYSSVLTAPIALAMLIVLAEHSTDPFTVAFLGAFGAVIGDLIIVKIFRENVYHNLASWGTHPLVRKLNSNRLRGVKEILGMIIIASPLPDELGLALLGASKMKYSEIAAITYIFNTIGILLIVLPVNLFG